jgi:hypothetical protein
MGGHQDNGTFADDKAHHEGRKVPRERFMSGPPAGWTMNNMVKGLVGQNEDGPLCSNCTDDMGEVLEWHDRESIHPSKRVPCVGCGAK